LEQKQEAAANVYSLPLIPQTIKYLHATAGFPTKDTWVKAINNGNYASWLSLSVEVVNTYFSESLETQKGHMKKQQHNVRLTKQKLNLDEVSEDVKLARVLTK
jgi:hypothetical protein